jgi:tetrahydromethanopterin:alpha-L-glutamate ligase
MPRSAERVLRLVGAARPRIAIFSEARDWHARRIAHHLAALGAEPRHVRLAQCQFTTVAPSGIVIPGFRRTLPDACIVRSVPGGSFEAVTRRLGILHALRELGVVVWNDARVIERCVDKSTTTFLLQRAGIAVPSTWTAETSDMARAIAQRELRRGPLVLKPLFGSQGRGLRLLTGIDDLPSPEEVDSVYYLQRFMGVERDRRYHDFRILVVDGTAIAGMTRRCDSWITNVKQGGTPEPLAGDRQLDELAVRAAAAVGADFCGVDLLRGDDGAAVVLEVNSMPAWSGLQRVSTVDIAEALARGVLSRLEGRHRLRVPL